MSRLAHADCLVPRASVSDPAERLGIRRVLYEALGELGHVESVERYLLDPPDGPLRDYSAGDVDLDQFAIVRVVGRVTPYRHLEDPRVR